MSGRRNFFNKASMEADRVGSMVPMTRARCTVGFNSEEERIYQAMKAISPKWGWPKDTERAWTVEDQRRHARYAADPFNERTTWPTRGVIEAPNH